MDRITSSELLHASKIQHMNNLSWNIIGSLGDQYLVDMAVPECTCHDYRFTGLPCKHIMLLVQSGKAILPSQHLDSPWFSLDPIIGHMPEEDQSSADNSPTINSVTPDISSSSINMMKKITLAVLNQFKKSQHFLSEKAHHKQ
jgi:hypothetical protein